MHRYLTLFISLFFLTSLANAASLNDSYFSSNSGIICFDTSIIKDLLEANGEQSALTDYYDEMVTVIKERFGLDLNKDIEHMGFYLIFEENKIHPLGFLSGNFNIDEMLIAIKNNIASEPELLKSIVINGQKKPTLQIDQIIFVGQNSKTIWFCDEYQLKHLINKRISFEKTSDYVSDLIGKSNNFIILNKELWPRLFGYNQKELKIDLDNVKSISAYFNNFDVIINVNLDTKESAEVLKLQLEYYFKSFKGNIESLNINDNYVNILKKINTLYLSARTADIINSLKYEVKDNTLVILFPYDRTNFYNAASDFITNIAFPAYQKIMDENSITECYYAQHLITKAIDKYNSENEPLMTEYSDLTLRTSDCLPYEYSNITKRGCRYTNVGKLDEGGYIICEQHGPAVPLIKPQISKERYIRENEMLLCFDNMRMLLEAVNHFNSEIKHHYNNSKHNIDKDTPLISTEMNIELLKEKGFLKKDYIELPNCEYYIKGDMTVKDYLDSDEIDDCDEADDCDETDDIEESAKNKPKKGYVGCKKHGLLTKGQLYNAQYEFQLRRPNLDKNEALKQLLHKE